MKPAIFTQFIPAKGTKPARIKAFDHEGRTVWYVPHEKDWNDVNTHFKALRHFLFGPDGPFGASRWNPATTKHGYVWVYHE